MPNALPRIPPVSPPKPLFVLALVCAFMCAKLNLHLNNVSVGVAVVVGVEARANLVWFSGQDIAERHVFTHTHTHTHKIC